MTVLPPNEKIKKINKAEKGDTNVSIRLCEFAKSRVAYQTNLCVGVRYRPDREHDSVKLQTGALSPEDREPQGGVEKKCRR